MYDVAPAREHDAYGPTRRRLKDGSLQRLDSVQQHERDGETWHTNAATDHAYEADADKRELIATRQKPVSERPWDPFGTDLGDPGEISRRYVAPNRPDYLESKLAGADDRHLPEESGGDGKRNPMDADALADREAREMRLMRYDDVDDFTRDRRVTTWGERYYKPVGSPTVRRVKGRDRKGRERMFIISQNAFRRALRGPSNEQRRWARPTENEAIRSVVGTGKDTRVSITMTRGMLMLWRQVHDIQVQRGKIKDAGMSDILASTIAGLKPSETVTMTVYDRATLRKFRGAPKRFRKGPFGEFLDYITRL